MKPKRSEPIEALILLAFTSIARVSLCCQDLLCYVDFIDTLTCEYRKDKDLNSSVSHSLSANWTFEEWNDTCLLDECEKNHKYICTIDMEDFTVDGMCIVTIITKNNGRYHSKQICQPFNIGNKFKPVPPFNLTVSLSENYNISWNTLYDNHDTRGGELAYELSYKKDGESWLNQKTIQVLEDEKHVVLLRSSFQAGEQYVARIRTQPKIYLSDIYQGHWSDWSTSIMWRTPANDQTVKMQIGMISGMIAILAFLGILMTCFRYSPLIWKKVWVLVPDPEPFFKPLYKGHQGDFKSWLGPHYTPFPIIPREGGSIYPEVLEIDCHSACNNMEIKKQFLPKLYLTEKNQICRTCGCTTENPCSQCCPPCIASTTTTTDGTMNEEDRSRDYGYPSVNLDSGNMLDREPSPQSTIMLKFGLPQDFLRSSMNMLSLVSIPPEQWELQESPSQEDDENVFYNDDNYNSLSPDSGNSGNFGYPRICLDMDTIDSGFVDSECGSPVDSNFGTNYIPTKPLNPDPYSEEDEICERNYVQQWVPTGH
ncbi:interleukin-21 receptor [Bufo bufo]|uniref:interleukin-21 receptor n=1 Tax=Bufo bufo TaxID=8384 RepID=UPI001ABE763B|nr:interleukin-21 receptor [Bufo bufo]XP_040296602.1 interleukin-21 receptor [Bufo bufo]XP_040296603.1 interleukin-21 receptor [Bufo bufo]